MSDDLLKAATRALREETDDAEQQDGRFTRARVMASLHQGKVKRRTRLAFLLPLAACLAAGTAWGAATGRLPAMFRAIGQAVSYTAKPPESQSQAVPAQPREPAPAAPVAAPPEPPASEPAPQAEPAPPLPAAPKLEPAPKSAPSVGSSASFQDADGDLYRLAHEAHFTAQDYGRALLGWDAYLRAAPRGRLATEARFNRAICLLRLGRDAEAHTALEPFASGKLGGYRQSEAAQLLSELGAAPPSP